MWILVMGFWGTYWAPAWQADLPAQRTVVVTEQGAAFSGPEIVIEEAEMSPAQAAIDQ